MTDRLHLAFLSPLPPTRSGIADFNAALLPYLAERADITLLVDKPDKLASSLKERFPHYQTSLFSELRYKFDLPIYHIGNNALHSEIYHQACRFPGLTILHDLNLNQFVSNELVVTQRDLPAFIRELAYEEGPAGYHFGRRLWLNQVGNDSPGVNFNKRLVRRSLGVIVHNRRAQQQLAAAHPDRLIRHVPLLVNQFPDSNLRQQLNLPDDAFVFATVGQLNRIKQIEWSLEQFAAIRADFSNAHFLLVGETLAGEIDIPAVLTRLDLPNAVHHVGYVPDPADFLRWTAAADVVVALRQPTLGETSAAALNGLAAGKPLIVFDQGWYSELPNSIAVKVPVLDEATFQRALRYFLEKPALAREMGAAGLQYVKQEHQPERVASRQC